MGLLSNIFGRSKHSETQADAFCEDERTLDEQLVDAEAYLARVRELPQSNWKPRIINGQFVTYSVDAKDNAIAYAKADVAELKVRIKGIGLVASGSEPTRTHTKSAPNNVPRKESKQ